MGINGLPGCKSMIEFPYNNDTIKAPQAIFQEY